LVVATTLLEVSYLVVRTAYEYDRKRRHTERATDQSGRAQWSCQTSGLRIAGGS
jgi:hypothetical protein